MSFSKFLFFLNESRILFILNPGSKRGLYSNSCFTILSSIKVEYFLLFVEKIHGFSIKISISLKDSYIFF